MGRLLGKRSDVMGAAMKPHVHAAVIKAWADGADVQFKPNDLNGWQDWVISTFGATPSFSVDWQWRVKTTPVKLMYRVALMKDRNDFFTTTVDSMEEAAEIFGDSEFVKWASEWEMVEA
ncbi:MAG: hypothetical protein RJA63_1573 [Pseudomonadota bacterium]|jgi:hypothetical protein